LLPRGIRVTGRPAGGRSEGRGPASRSAAGRWRRNADAPSARDIGTKKNDIEQADQRVGSSLSDQDEFVRQLRKFARKTGMAVVVDKTKGSHARKYGARVTTVPRNLGPGLRKAILKEQGIDPIAFEAI
jgi:predicted RNA binding protein YcfA (HicA-like mRNA interferase family)